MAVIRCKEGVVFGGFTPALVIILGALVGAAKDLAEPAEVIITAGSNGEHSHYSRHYSFEAVDVRTHNFPSEAAAREFAQAVSHMFPLGRFTVLFEDEGLPNEHLHIQPLKGTVYP